MHRGRLLATATAAAMAVAGFTGVTTAQATPQATDTGEHSSSWLVLTRDGATARSVANQLQASGAVVTSVNAAIGLVSVRSSDSGFRSDVSRLAGVQGVAADVSIGSAPKDTKVRSNRNIEREHATARGKGTSTTKPAAATASADPLDSYLWGMDMLDAPAAHAVTLGDKRVKVGIMDTGVQGDHPDLAPNFDAADSRNFTTDIPAIDGPCEYAGCVDPANVDDNGHGTHVAGTIGAALNGRGLSGVAPDVTLVNVRAGQDSGYFFLGPVTNALTYSGDTGIDVVNMSFYVDPWLYNCSGGAPEDSAPAAADQAVIIAAMTRALNYAHAHGVTMVAALGNNHEDISHPRVDTSSPDYDNPAYTWDNTIYPRTIDNASCLDLPVEGSHVIGVSALGPSGKKADYSNYATDLGSGELEVSAPGGWFRDGFGTPTFRTNQNEILSTAPLHVLQAEGSVDPAGNITPQGTSLGVMKDCVTSNGSTTCGYYQYLQGTSMASPHAAGVAALAVSAHGSMRGRLGFGMAPGAVADLMMRTATDHACPPGGVQSYTNEGRSAEFTATCVGTPDVNAFYGDGIVNALGVVR